MKFSLLFYLFFFIFKRFSSSPIEKKHFDVYNYTVIKLESSLNARMPQVDDYLSKVYHNLKKQEEADGNSINMPKSTENKEYINRTSNLSNTTDDRHENDLDKMKKNENSFHHKQIEILNITVRTDGSPSLTYIKKNWGNELIFDNESHMINSSQKGILDNDRKDAASKVGVLDLNSENVGQQFSQENISISNNVTAEGETLGNDLSRNSKKLESKESIKNEENSKDDQTINRDQSIVTTTPKAVYSNLNTNSPKVTNAPNLIKKISKKYQNSNKETESTSVIGFMNQNGFKTKRSKESEAAEKHSNERKSYSKASHTTANTEKNSNQGKMYSKITSTAASIDFASQQKIKTSKETEKKLMKKKYHKNDMMTEKLNFSTSTTKSNDSEETGPQQNGSSFLKNIKIDWDNELIFDNESLMINSSQKEILVNGMKDAASEVEVLDLNVEKDRQQFSQENKNISSNVTKVGKDLRNGLSQIRNLEKLELEESNTNEENSKDDQKINREQSIQSTTSKAVQINLNSNNPKVNNTPNLIKKFSKRHRNANEELKSTSLTAFENQSGFKIKLSKELEVTEKNSNEGLSHNTTTAATATAKESLKQEKSHSKTTLTTANAKETPKQGESHSKTTPTAASAKESSKQGESHSKTTPSTANAKENSEQGKSYGKTTSAPATTDHDRQQKVNISKERDEILMKNKYRENDVTTGDLKFSTTITKSNDSGETDPSHGKVPKNGQSKILMPTKRLLNNENNQEQTVNTKLNKAEPRENKAENGTSTKNVSSVI